MIDSVKVNQLLERAVQSGTAPGVIALAGDATGATYQGACGRREVGKDAPMSLDTVMGIASMTKPVTAVAAMQLVERNRLSLDEPVGKHLPILGNIMVLEGFDSVGAPRLRPPRRPITLRHLLTHSSGLGYDLWSAELVKLKQFQGGQLDLTTPLVFDPGERWLYGTSIDWIGRLVETISGVSLEDYFREHILDPLGMSDTSFLVRPGQRSRLARGHHRQPDGSFTPFQDERPDRPDWFNGGGGLLSTGPDYLRFMRMFLNGGQLDGMRILRPETIAEMGRNQLGDLVVEPLRTTDPRTSEDVELFPGIEKKWGFGGLINVADTPTGRTSGSWAWAGLFNTYFWVDPTRNVAGMLLTQLLPFADPRVLDLFGQFERLVYEGLG